jgi:glutaminase
MNKIVQGVGNAIVRPAPPPALSHFLKHCLDAYGGENQGAVADYIPELSKASPAHFGIGLATIDGHVYQAGDAGVEFTIQSISKAFVFALALELLGQDRVEAKIGVEPSGESFNSIRLNADNRPFNAMVNAGAIACSGLIYDAEGSGAFDRVLDTMSRFAGRKLSVDEAVFQSERATGDRNRAIGYLLRNNAVLQGNVDEVLDVYFRQCSILVTARDLAVMAGTLANRGVNPVTNEQVATPYAVARTLSVMTTSGMYDYAGEWTYRVGVPAKSGVGGGIIAALPAQFGLGTFSPPLDSHGNSVRGLKVCEEISSHFDLHMLNRSSDVRTSIIADYDIRDMSSRRIRQPHEQAILDDHCRDIRVIELIGALNFANVDYVSRQIALRPRPDLLIIDLRRVPAVTEGGARLFADMLRDLASTNMTTVLSGVDKSSAVWTALAAGLGSEVRRFDLADEAIEWAEDQLIYRYGGFSDGSGSSPLTRQALLDGLDEQELAEISALGETRSFHTGERIIAAGDPASSIFFLLSGMVSVKLVSGSRLASLSHGMVFGEMALIDRDRVRSADVWADSAATCLELSIGQFEVFCERHQRAGQRVSHNLAVLLAKRLIQANARVDLLSSY